MASTVGSYVLGNQMRGRAIRINRNDPDKVSNIWHLVCMSTPQEEAERRRMGIEEPEMSDDFRTLERRMEGVRGVSYDGTVSYTHLDVYKRQNPLSSTRLPAR